MELKSLEDLEGELKRGLVRSVYLLTGPEEYLRRLAEEQILRHTLAPESQPFNFSEFSLAVHPLDDALKAADTFPLASPFRLVILRNVNSPTEDQEEALLRYLKQPSKKTVLVLVAENIDRRKTFFRSLKDKHCVADFQSPKPATFKQWAGDLLRKRGYQASRVAIEKLVALAGSDFRTLLGEIEKLTLYAGSDKSIPDSALDELVRESTTHSAFDLTDAMGRRDIKAALRLLHGLLESGEPTLKILGAISWNFRNVLMVQEQLASGKTSGQIVAALHLNPYSAEKLIGQARALDGSHVRRLYERLAALDLRLKSSAVDERMLLENLICSI